MPDRKKVIKALEDFNKNRICLPHLIPWDEIADAISLLKEQEYKDRMFHALEDDWKAVLKEQEAVEPKTGHWIWLQFCANEGVYCSECHTKMFDSYPMKKKLSQFCGHCGAKMVDEVEGR